MVRFFRFIAGISREIRYSRLMLGLVILSGLISGVATTGLIALVNRALTGQGFHGINPRVAFAVLSSGCRCSLPVAGAARQPDPAHALSDADRLVPAHPHDADPPARADRAAPPAAPASPTTWGAITDALLVLPLLIMHMGVIATCLAYLGWLSPKLLGVSARLSGRRPRLVSMADMPRLFLRPPLA